MTPCEIASGKLFAYLDGELRDGELAGFESHLSACPSCQVEMAGRRRFLAAISRARPELTAAPELRQRVQGILALSAAQTSQEAKAVPGFLERAVAALGGLRWMTPRAAFAMAILVAVLSGVWVERAARRPRSEFAAAALEAHQRRMDGRLALEFRSSSAEAVSTWFQGRLPVQVHLPADEDLPRQAQPYQLEGAGVVPFHGTELGYVAYRVGGKPVSLLIAPIWAATLAGRRQIQMKSLTIHYDSAGGFHVVTWAVPRKGITYALVSDTHQHANQSCIVCHAGPKDRVFMRALLN